MVRFTVIKGSRLLLGVAIVVLALVVCALVVKYVLSEPVQPTMATGSFVTQTDDAMEARAVSAFASNQEESVSILILDPNAAPEAEDEHTDEVVSDISIEIIPDGSASIAASVNAPRVLIYHTHTHEAYEQEADDPYAAVEAWRTTDEAHSIVRVGDELAELLRKRGFSVVHDTTDHELNELSTAYTRSLETLEKYEEDFDLYIDLHRDAYVENTGAITLSAGGQEVAKLMMLIGSGESFQVKPHYAENYAFAAALTERLNAVTPGICKDVLVKKNRYNQHIGVHSILIEVGNNKNTLSEAVASMPYLAEAIDYVMVTADPDSPVVQLAADGS